MTLSTYHGPYGPEYDPLDNVAYELMDLPLLSNRRERAMTQSSTFSNPASFRGAEADDEIAPEAAEPTAGTQSEEDTSYLVEIISHPCFQLEKERARVLLKGDFDAVLLVYDITSRTSFETVAELHNGIPLNARRGWSSLGRRSSWWQALGRGTDEIVVGLVGNKCDLDAGFRTQDFDLDAVLLQKEDVVLDDVASEREVVHPLFRESRLFDCDSLPLSPISINTFGASQQLSTLTDSLRPYGSAGAALQARLSVSPSQRSANTLKTADGDRILQHSRPSSRHIKVQSWLDTGSPTVDARSDGERDRGTSTDGPNSSTPTTAAMRQVSRLEGELVARTLLLQVPFFETSAKTGEQVEELFEAVVREVLTEAGRGKGGQGEPRGQRKNLAGGGRDHGIKEKGESPKSGNQNGGLLADGTFFLDTRTSEPEGQPETIDGQVAGQAKARRASVLERMRKALHARPGRYGSLA